MYTTNTLRRQYKSYVIMGLHDGWLHTGQKGLKDLVLSRNIISTGAHVNNQPFGSNDFFASSNS